MLGLYDKYVVLHADGSPVTGRCFVWIRDIVRQCKAARVPVFVKQMGTMWARDHGADRNGANMRLWAKDLQVRQLPGGK